MHRTVLAAFAVGLAAVPGVASSQEFDFETAPLWFRGSLVQTSGAHTLTVTAEGDPA